MTVKKPPTNIVNQDTSLLSLLGSDMNKVRMHIQTLVRLHWHTFFEFDWTRGTLSTTMNKPVGE